MIFPVIDTASHRPFKRLRRALLIPALLAIGCAPMPSAQSGARVHSNSGLQRAPLVDASSTLVDASSTLVDASSTLDATLGDAASSIADAALARPTASEGSSLRDEPIESFSDPRALEQLARNPAWHPESDAPELIEGLEDPLFCQGGTSYQSCVSEPCHEGVGEPCRAGCARACTTCDARCRVDCASCHRACADDACRARCASTCGRCLDSCRTTKDRCVSGECARRYQACYARFGADFVRACLPACQRCTARCERAEQQGQCVHRCALRRCSRDQAAWCVMTGPVDPRRTDER